MCKYFKTNDCSLKITAAWQEIKHLNLVGINELNLLNIKRMKRGRSMCPFNVLAHVLMCVDQD